MTIGEALKKEREKQNISKYKFSEGVVDRKFYGKVEQNEGMLSSDKLIRLLIKNQIDIDSFFNEIRMTYEDDQTVKKQKLEEQMRLAFDERNITEIKAIKQKIMELDDEKILKLRVTVSLAYLEGKTDQISAETKNQIFKELDQHENLSKDVEAIRLFSQVMPIFTDKQLNYLVSSFLNKVKNNKVRLEIEEKRIAIILNNYLSSCHDRNLDTPLADEVMDYLMKMPNVHLLIYKMVGKFDFEMIKEHVKKAEKIKQELNEWGYKLNAKNLK